MNWAGEEGKKKGEGWSVGDKEGKRGREGRKERSQGME